MTICAPLMFTFLEYDFLVPLGVSYMCTGVMLPLSSWYSRLHTLKRLTQKHRAPKVQTQGWSAWDCGVAVWTAVLHTHTFKNTLAFILIPAQNQWKNRKQDNFLLIKAVSVYLCWCYYYLVFKNKLQNDTAQRSILLKSVDIITIQLWGKRASWWLRRGINVQRRERFATCATTGATTTRENIRLKKTRFCLITVTPYVWRFLWAVCCWPAADVFYFLLFKTCILTEWWASDHWDEI